MWGYQASQENMKNWHCGIWTGKGWANDVERE